ncbi:MAG: N-acetylmuramoyl-L-alanine amidase [Anaerotignum faecicola]
MKGIFLRREWVSLVCCFCIIGVCLVHTALGKETKALFPMMGVRVVLDAGHGGWDPGKTGTGGENEKILNLAVTEKLTEYLEQGGAEVILTRNEDTALGGSSTRIWQSGSVLPMKQARISSSASIRMPSPLRRQRGRRCFIIKAVKGAKSLRNVCRKA